MPNEILTHQMIAREAVKMFKEDTFIKTINTGRSEEFKDQPNGYKKGDKVDIGVPPTPAVFDGANFAGGGNAPDMNETKVSLQLNKQKHVPITFTAKEKLLSLSDFKERFLAPSMQALASKVQADLLLDMKNSTPNVVGTWGSVPNSRLTYGQARASLQRFLAPADRRCVQFSSDANLNLSEANATLFNASREIDDIYRDGAVGDYASFSFFENQSLPVHANGAGAGYVVNGANQTGSGLIVGTGTGAITRGTVFTIANVFATQPITGENTGELRRFVVTADHAGGAGTLQIYPALIPTTATRVGTVTASPANSAAVTIFGTANQARRQNLAYQKNAFTAAFAPLPVLASCEGYTASIQGISVRVMTFGDGKTDMEHTRIDVLYGNAATRPDHMVRITE